MKQYECTTFTSYIRSLVLPCTILKHYSSLLPKSHPSLSQTLRVNWWCNHVDRRRELYWRQGRFALRRCHPVILALLGSFEPELSLRSWTLVLCYPYPFWISDRSACRKPVHRGQGTLRWPNTAFKVPMLNSPLLLTYLWFGTRFLREPRLTTEEFIHAFWLRCVLLLWQSSHESSLQDKSLCFSHQGNSKKEHFKSPKVYPKG